MRPEIEREMDKVRAKQDRAMADQASQGSTQQGVMEAGIRAALDHALSELDPDLGKLEKALGEQIDGGAFLMGMMGAAFAMQGLNLVEISKLPIGRRLFREYISKAGQR
jgi:hypothetical protein